MAEEPSAATRASTRLGEGRGVLFGLALVGAAAVAFGGATLWAALSLVAAAAALIAFVPRPGEERPAPAAASAADPGFDPLLARVVDALPEPAFVLGRGGVLRHANDRALQAFPVRPGDLVTARFRHPALVAALDRVDAGGAAERVEYGERLPMERWYAAWLAPLAATGPGGPPELVLLLLDDQTEAKRTDRMRTDFVANASHELRTPLASLAGFIETLQGPARDDAAARERFLGIMHDQATRMSRLISDLLSLSRVEMKAHVRPSDPVDLVAVLRHVVEATAPLAAELKVAVALRVPDDAVVVPGDRDELVQVFDNLVENAAKYGQSGGRVEISLDGPGTGGEPATVTVRDYGPGIPREHIPRLTERFYRVDADASRKHRGTGLGLAIAKHILTRHRARLRIDSRPGEGASFAVDFPQARSGEAPNPEVPPVT